MHFILTPVFIKIGIIVVANSGIVWQSELIYFLCIINQLGIKLNSINRNNIPLLYNEYNALTYIKNSYLTRFIVKKCSPR